MSSASPGPSMRCRVAGHDWSNDRVAQWITLVAPERPAGKSRVPNSAGDRVMARLAARREGVRMGRRGRPRRDTVGFFATTLAGLRHAVRSEARADSELRPRCRPFEAVGEALASDPACRLRDRLVLRRLPVRGLELAGDGCPLDDALDGLRAPPARAVTGRDPSYADGPGAARGLERGDARLPPPAHLRGPADRTRQPRPPAQPALRALPRPAVGSRPGARDTTRSSSLDTRVDPGDRDPSARRCAWPARRDRPHGLPGRRDRRPGRHASGSRSSSAATTGSPPARRCSARCWPASHPARVWIEALPHDDSAAAALLDELARR